MFSESASLFWYSRKKPALKSLLNSHLLWCHQRQDRGHWGEEDRKSLKTFLNFLIWFSILRFKNFFFLPLSVPSVFLKDLSMTESRWRHCCVYIAAPSCIGEFWEPNSQSYKRVKKSTSPNVTKTKYYTDLECACSQLHYYKLII